MASYFFLERKNRLVVSVNVLVTCKSDLCVANKIHCPDHPSKSLSSNCAKNNRRDAKEPTESQVGRVKVSVMSVL